MSSDPQARLDHVGAIIAGACAVHCLLVPLAFALIPSLTFALYAYSHPAHGLAITLLHVARFEWVVALCASCTALASTLVGALRHQQLTPVALAIVGSVLLGGAALLALAQQQLLLHTGLAVVGGTCLIAAHTLNRRALNRRRFLPQTSELRLPNASERRAS